MTEEDVFSSRFPSFLEPDQKFADTLSRRSLSTSTPFPRFLEPNQKFADTLSRRSLSTSTPCVRRNASAVKVENDSGYAESLGDSMCSSHLSGYATSAHNISDVNFDMPGSSNHGSTQVFHSEQYCNDIFESARKPVPKFNMNLFCKSLKCRSDWDAEEDNEQPSLEEPDHLHTTVQFPRLPSVDEDFIPDDSDIHVDSWGTSSLGASGLAIRLTEVLKHFSPKEPDRVIGRKMLLEHVDIIEELDSRNLNFSCTSLIFKYLDPEDLCRVCHVSRLWRSVCQNDRVANSRRLKHQRKHKLTFEKENAIGRKSPRKSRGMTTTGSTPFHQVQLLGNIDTSSQKLVTPKATGKWELYNQAGQSLKNDESLRSCRKCSHPSKVYRSQERAKCQNPLCRFDFCVNCFSHFHGASPCVPVASKKTKTDIIGSKKSKKNLQRL